MTLWIWLSLGAAFAQNLRSAVQKRLAATLSTGGATATRFVYGLPFAAAYLLVLTEATDASLPTPTAAFAAFTLLGALAQIGATALLLTTFRTRSFAAGTTFSKTEGIQTVLVGYVLLGDTLGPAALGGIALTAAGVLLVSIARTGIGLPTLPGTATDRWRVVGLGLLSGTLFAVSAVSYRGASLSLDAPGDGDGFAVRAACTLVAALAVQSAATSLYLRLREPGELGRLARAWRAGLVAGATGAAASAGWFTAFTLADAALVKAVGSVELVFAMAASRFVFGERPAASELVGTLVVVAGIVVTVLAS